MKGVLTLAWISGWKICKWRFKFVVFLPISVRLHSLQWVLFLLPSNVKFIHMSVRFLLPVFCCYTDTRAQYFTDILYRQNCMVFTCQLDALCTWSQLDHHDPKCATTIKTKDATSHWISFKLVFAWHFHLVFKSLTKASIHILFLALYIFIVFISFSLMKNRHWQFTSAFVNKSITACKASLLGQQQLAISQKVMSPDRSRVLASYCTSTSEGAGHAPAKAERYPAHGVTPLLPCSRSEKWRLTWPLPLTFPGLAWFPFKLHLSWFG